MAVNDNAEYNSDHEEAQFLRPRWVAWLVGGSVAAIVAVGGFAVAYVSFSTTTTSDRLHESDRLDYVETNPSVAASFKKEWEREWERDHGRPYTHEGRVTHQGDDVGVLENRDDSLLEPTTMSECTPVRDAPTTVSPAPTMNESGDIAAAAPVGPADMDCN